MNEIIKQLERLQKERNEINSKIIELSRKLFADYLNNDLKLCEYKDQFICIDNGNRTCYFVLKHDLTKKIFDWFNVNHIDYQTFDFNGVMIDVVDLHVATVRFRFIDKPTEQKFLKNFMIEI